MPSKNPMYSGQITATVGVQSAAVNVTATGDGASTGIIPE